MLAQLGGGDFAHAPDFFYRQHAHKLGHLIRAYQKLPIRLAPVAGDFGQEFVGRDTGRGGNAHLVADGVADGLRHQAGAALAVRLAAHVQVGFVQRQRLDQRGVTLVDGVHRLAGVAIAGKIGGHDQQLRALA